MGLARTLAVVEADAKTAEVHADIPGVRGTVAETK
jgi:hypothetical protein